MSNSNETYQNQSALNDRPLSGKRIAILATNGFQEDELVVPKERLFRAGAEVCVVSPSRVSIRAQQNSPYNVSVDLHVSNARAADFDALIIPGGLKNPDTLRADKRCVQLVKDFCKAPDKLVAAVCHGPWLLIEADAVSGKRVTSYASIQTDLKNAGANWVDEEVVVDGNIITSRKPADLKAFCNEIHSYLAPSTQPRSNAANAAGATVLDVMAEENSHLMAGSYEDLEAAEMQSEGGSGRTDSGHMPNGAIDPNRMDEVLTDVYANETVSVDLVLDEARDRSARANQDLSDEKI